jgi:hypothetical protein
MVSKYSSTGFTFTEISDGDNEQDALKVIFRGRHEAARLALVRSRLGYIRPLR